MKENIYELADLEIWECNGRFFARYDAGAHQIVMREDEISEDDAQQAMKDPKEASNMLLSLQKRLIENGIDPYVSNL